MHFYMHAYTHVEKGFCFMSASEAQLRANKKYHQKFHKLQIRISYDEKNTLDSHAEATGESVNSFVRRAITETIERDKSRYSQK